jgi:hypothetical protein
MSPETELVTMREAARRLGLGDSRTAERKLRRRVKQVEAASGRAIMVPGATGRAPCVTIAAIRAACGEFRASRVEDLVRLAREQLAAAVEREVGTQVTERVEPRLAQLWQRDEQIAETLIGALRRVQALESAVFPPNNRDTSGAFGSRPANKATGGSRPGGGSGGGNLHLVKLNPQK